MNAAIKLLAAAAILAPTTASAADFVETQAQTVSGQDFSFIFADVPTPLGDGMLSFLVRGDFTIGSSLQESFDINAEGIFAQTGIQATASNLVQSFGDNDNLFEVSYALSLSELSALAADGSIGVDVNFGSGVGAGLSANPFVETSLSFVSAQAAVPEPSAWALMVLGFFGLGAMMRRRNNRTRMKVSYS